MRSLLKLRSACQARGVGLHIELGGGEALIGRGRAALMTQFLKGDASHLLFVDSDIGFEPQAVFRLFDAAREVVGGVYPKKLQGPDSLVTHELDELPDHASASLRPVASIGAGFLLIARGAAERLAAAYPQLKARLGDLAGGAPQEAVMLFDSFTDPATGRHLSDYQAFCHRWRAIGGEVWADFASPLEHIGVVVHRARPDAAA
jgi:hypothetical protein